MTKSPVALVSTAGEPLAGGGSSSSAPKSGPAMAPERAASLSASETVVVSRKTRPNSTIPSEQQEDGRHQAELDECKALVTGASCGLGRGPVRGAPRPAHGRPAPRWGTVGGSRVAHDAEDLRGSRRRPVAGMVSCTSVHVPAASVVQLTRTGCRPIDHPSGDDRPGHAAVDSGPRTVTGADTRHVPSGFTLSTGGPTCNRRFGRRSRRGGRIRGGRGHHRRGRIGPRWGDRGGRRYRLADTRGRRGPTADAVRLVRGLVRCDIAEVVERDEAGDEEQGGPERGTPREWRHGRHDSVSRPARHSPARRSPSPLVIEPTVRARHVRNATDGRLLGEFYHF